jgi:hypothetical protein
MNAKLSKGSAVRTRERILSFAGLASLMLFGAGPTRAQSSVPAASTPRRQDASATISSVQAKEVAAQPGETESKDQDTGIKVHGHWVINVFSPNGQLVSHTEFENSLQSTGMEFLAQVLGGQKSVGNWELSFAGTSGPCTTLFAPTGTPVGTCVIKPGTATVTSCGSNGCTSNIMEPPQVPFNGTTMQLIGALTFPSAGNITQVETIVSNCNSSTSPFTCYGNPAVSKGVFTSANLPTAVKVAANQLVQITVTFSFS